MPLSPFRSLGCFAGVMIPNPEAVALANSINEEFAVVMVTGPAGSQKSAFLSYILDQCGVCLSCAPTPAFASLSLSQSVRLVFGAHRPFCRPYICEAVPRAAFARATVRCDTSWAEAAQTGHSDRDLYRGGGVCHEAVVLVFLPLASRLCTFRPSVGLGGGGRLAQGPGIRLFAFGGAAPQAACPGPHKCEEPFCVTCWGLGGVSLWGSVQCLSHCSALFRGRRCPCVTAHVTRCGGWYASRLQMPLKLEFAARGTVAGHRLGALEGGGGTPPPLSNTSLTLTPVDFAASVHPSAVLPPLGVGGGRGWACSRYPGAGRGRTRHETLAVAHGSTPANDASPPPPPHGLPLLQSRHATSVRQGNGFSVGTAPVSTATQ